MLVDPPRKGMDAACIDAITAMSPEKIVYISCNPATQARDAAILEERGYKVTRLRAFDMFPRTGHVETVCLLINQNAQAKHHVNVGIDAEDYCKIKEGK